MITEDKINKIYEAIGMEQELTTKFLNALGFNSNDLAKLIEKGYLKRIKRGYYDVTRIEPLYEYGSSMLVEEPKTAYNCLKKCYKMDSNYCNLGYNLVFLGILEKDYIQVLECLQLERVNKYTYTNHRFYLLLLSKLIELPDKYKEIVNKLKLTDIQFLPNEVNQVESKTRCRQKIRTLVFHNEFFKASKVRIEGKLTQCDKIVICLLNDITQMRGQKLNVLLQTIKDKNYTNAIAILEHMDNLCKYEKTILSLLHTLEKMISEKIIPNKLDFKSDNIYEAIADENYEWALHLSNKFYDMESSKKETSILHLLLVAINEKIHELENNYEDKQESEEASVINPEIICPALVYLLLRHDLERFRQYLPEYLCILKKDKYQEIIGYLFELDTLEQDGVFTKTVNFINHLTDDEPLNISEYIQYVKDSILNRKLNHARLYLKVISSYGQINNKLISKEELEFLLPQLLQCLGLEKEDNAVSVQTEEKCFIHEDFKDENLLDADCIEQLPEVVIEPPIVENTSEIDISNVNFLQKKYDQLMKQQGIIILKPMKESKRQQLEELARNYEDMTVFTIGMGEPKRLVLRYKPKNHEFININQKVTDANLLYRQRKYKMAAEIYADLLQVGNPSEFIYAKLGLSYIQMNKIKLAIDYLTVATELSLIAGNCFDFTELIAKLRNEKIVEDVDRKTMVSMDIQDFSNDIDEYYGIDDIDSIAHLVASGLDVKEACDQLGLTTEQMGLVLLIFARECYLQNYQELGDSYLKRAERFENKTPLMKKLLNNINRNKKLYSNRDTTNHKRLILLPEY